MSLCRMRTREILLATLRILASAALGVRLAYGAEKNHHGLTMEVLGPVWRARASQAFARKPGGARGGAPRVGRQDRVLSDDRHGKGAKRRGEPRSGERAHRDVCPGLSRGAGCVAEKVAPSGRAFSW